MITRLRLDAALYAPVPSRQPGQTGRPRLKGKRLPTLAAIAVDTSTRWTSVTIAHWYGARERTVEVVTETAVWYHSGMPPVPLRWLLIRDPLGEFATQALLCTDCSAPPAQILSWFVQRWQLEVTFEEVRRHLGVETQRQWSDLAIRRTTPALFGLFSLVTLLTHNAAADTALAVRQSAWYRKQQPTFADALACVRRDLWQHVAFCISDSDSDLVKVPRVLVERLTESLAYVA